MSGLEDEIGGLPISYAGGPASAGAANEDARGHG